MTKGTKELEPVLSLNTLLIMVGYSFYKAVAYNSYVTNFTLTQDAYGYVSDIYFMLGATVGILISTMSVFVLSRKRILSAFGLGYKVPLLILASLYIIAPLFLQNTDSFISRESLGLIWGLSTTVLMIVWVELFVYVKSPIAFILQLTCASFFSAVISVAIGQLSQTFNIVICIVMALSCIPIIGKCREKSTPYSVEHEKKVSDKKKTSHSGLWQTLKEASTPILAYFCFELVVGLINIFAYEGSSSFRIATSAPIQGMLICSVLLILFVLATNKAPGSTGIYLIVFPLIIAIFLALPFFGDSLGKAMSSVIYAAYVFTSMFALFYYVTAARKHKADIYQVAAFVSGGVRIMLMIGFALGYWFSHMIKAETYVQLSIVVVVCVYFLGIVVVYWGYRTAKNRPPLQAEQKSESVVESYEQSILAIVDELVDKHKLTNRERDVLIELSRGNSAARIAEDLFISTSTVQGYIKSLYAKLGVNKKQQVLDLFKPPN